MNTSCEHADWRGWIHWIGLILAGLSVLLALACLVSFQKDGVQLRAMAEEVTRSHASPAQKVLALVDWIHHNQPAQENGKAFIFPRLRATPMQVLRGGGDCADKSRLLCALLREVNIPSSMVLCFSRRSAVPTHTVVEAQIGPGSFMVVDPAYNLAFPKEHTNSYFNLLELRADPQILDRRLADLIPTLPPTAPVYCYKPEQAAYDNASTFNWQKNRLTRFIRDALAIVYGNDVYRISRPIILEEPKLTVATLLGLASVFFVVLSRLFGGLTSRWMSALGRRVVPCGP